MDTKQTKLLTAIFLSKETSLTLIIWVCLPHNSRPHGGVGGPFLLHRLLQTAIYEPQCPGWVIIESPFK